jgi:hypothetical protein
VELGAPGYIATENGQVFGKRGTSLKFKIDYDGYCLFSASYHHKHKYYRVHRFIWEYFNGPIPKELQINHINGIKTDNRLGNLELVTHKENIRHAWRIGLYQPRRGENSPNYKHGRYVK